MSMVPDDLSLSPATTISADVLRWIAAQALRPWAVRLDILVA